jgi:dinuclear metal center YbgI/SA1388 family protein
MAIALPKILSALAEIAPLELAEDWDNVGLLLEPPRRKSVSRILLAIDLTEPVLDEAIRARAELVVAYHPPIFAPLRRLTSAEAKERIVLRCIEKRIAVYSPHTALDAVSGGVNDWLAEALGAGERRPIVPVDGDDGAIGQGRLVSLDKPVALATVVRRVKRHLGLAQVRVARSSRHARGAKVRSVALCAGAGGSVLEGVAADLYWTGEMRHHDVLAANAAGASVILCEHTNTERGYLDVLASRLADAVGAGVQLRVSRVDRDPMEIV